MDIERSSACEELLINEFKLVELAVVKFWRKGNIVTSIEIWDDQFVYKLKGEMELESVSRR